MSTLPAAYPEPMLDDDSDQDCTAIQAAIDLVAVILQTDPGVYDEIAAPVLLLLKERLK